MSRTVKRPIKIDYGYNLTPNRQDTNNIDGLTKNQNEKRLDIRLQFATSCLAYSAIFIEKNNNNKLTTTLRVSERLIRIDQNVTEICVNRIIQFLFFYLLPTLSRTTKKKLLFFLIHFKGIEYISQLFIMPVF